MHASINLFHIVLFDGADVFPYLFGYHVVCLQYVSDTGRPENQDERHVEESAHADRRQSADGNILLGIVEVATHVYSSKNTCT